MKTIAVSTTTRADFGLLAPVIKKLMAKPELDVRVLASGTHLSDSFGHTIDEIKNEGIPVFREIPILSGDDSPKGVSQTMANALSAFASCFEELHPDALLVLGDRYETLAVCCAAMNARIPIIHLYGGETTEGAVDEGIRHAITKLSNLHFVANDEFRNRVIHMGESPDRVFAVGAMGIENAKNAKLLTKQELEESLSFHLGSRYAVLTFHPVTLEEGTAATQIKELMSAVEQFPDVRFICTKANADADGSLINDYIAAYAASHENAALFDSLGAKRYLSAVSGAEFVIGNSSSGLAEPPAFGVPTINIGDRQKGRPQGASIINCRPMRDEIIKAINLALSPEFKEIARNTDCPYGDGNTSGKIADITADFLLNNKMCLKKKFYDLPSD